MGSRTEIRTRESKTPRRFFDDRFVRELQTSNLIIAFIGNAIEKIKISATFSDQRQPLGKYFDFLRQKRNQP